MAMSADSGTPATVSTGVRPRTSAVALPTHFRSGSDPVHQYRPFAFWSGIRYVPTRSGHVRLRLLLLRVQGRVPRPVAGVLESRQDRLLAGRRSRSRHRPARGLLLLGHG